MARKLGIDARIAPIRINCDAEKIALVLENLLVNAIKYSPRGGRVTLEVAQHGGEAWIDVVDQGPGIAPDERARVFEWFYHGRSPADNVVKSSGLGLAIAQEIVHAHGGAIEVVEQAEKGARFRVRLPIAAETEHAN
jgi:two-component system sensor histidine kinase GlrK